MSIEPRCYILLYIGNVAETVFMAENQKKSKSNYIKKLIHRVISRSVGVVGYHVSLTSSSAQGPGFEPQMDHLFWLFFEFFEFFGIEGCSSCR